jgi:hypothetical protein
LVAELHETSTLFGELLDQGGDADRELAHAAAGRCISKIHSQTAADCPWPDRFRKHLFDGPLV